MFGRDRPQTPEFDHIASDAGAVLTLYKPFRPHEVLCAVTQALGMSASAA
jgi:hypothetical protein